jgi:hypothetical protein
MKDGLLARDGASIAWLKLGKKRSYDAEPCCGGCCGCCELQLYTHANLQQQQKDFVWWWVAPPVAVIAVLQGYGVATRNNYLFLAPFPSATGCKNLQQKKGWVVADFLADLVRPLHHWTDRLQRASLPRKALLQRLAQVIAGHLWEIMSQQIGRVVLSRYNLQESLKAAHLEADRQLNAVINQLKRQAESTFGGNRPWGKTSYPRLGGRLVTYGKRLIEHGQRLIVLGEDFSARRLPQWRAQQQAAYANTAIGQLRKTNELPKRDRTSPEPEPPTLWTKQPGQKASETSELRKTANSTTPLTLTRNVSGCAMPTGASRMPRSRPWIPDAAKPAVSAPEPRR